MLKSTLKIKIAEEHVTKIMMCCLSSKVQENRMENKLKRVGF
jgi:hypothetical protein